MIRKILFVFIIVLTGCTSVPKGVSPVDDFDINRYLGKWYEIARLDHSFERGLERVSAEYSLRDDGGITVINRGFSVPNKTWKEAQGKAYFVDDTNKGHLKVSFFGPFYSSYVVFELDKQDYQYAFIAGYNTSYLWLLARKPRVSQALVDDFIKQAKALGFATENLIFVKQE